MVKRQPSMGPKCGNMVRNASHHYATAHGESKVLASNGSTPCSIRLLNSSVLNREGRVSPSGKLYFLHTKELCWVHRAANVHCV